MNGVEARGVGFRCSTRIASRVRSKVRNGSVLMETECLNTRFPGSVWLPCDVRGTGQGNGTNDLHYSSTLIINKSPKNGNYENYSIQLPKLISHVLLEIKYK